MATKRTSKTQTQEPEAFTLPRETIRLGYILKQKGNITNKNHVAYGGRLDDATDLYVAKTDEYGDYIDILTEEEKEYLEAKLALSPGSLNPNTVGGYYSKIGILLGKSGIKLNLNKASDYIKYKVLLSYTDKVSPDIFSSHLRKTYDYEVINEEDVQSKVTKRVNYNKEAYKLFGKIEDSKVQLLGAYKSLTGKKVSPESSQEWLVGQIGTLVESNAKLFVDTLTDPLYESKLFIEQAIDAGAIKKLKGLYYTTDGMEISNEGEIPTLINAISYLDSVENQDLRLVIELKMK